VQLNDKPMIQQYLFADHSSVLPKSIQIQRIARCKLHCTGLQLEFLKLKILMLFNNKAVFAQKTAPQPFWFGHLYCCISKSAVILLKASGILLTN